MIAIINESEKLQCVITLDISEENTAKTASVTSSSDCLYVTLKLPKGEYSIKNLKIKE